MSNTSDLVSAYRQFYRAIPPFDMRQAALPISIAFDVVRDANRKLFDSREALVEAIAGAVLPITRDDGAEGANVKLYKQLWDFAEVFLDMLPPAAVDDPGVIRKPFRELIENACAIVYFDAEKQKEKEYSVTRFADKHGVERSYILAEIRRGKIKAEMIGGRYTILESENVEWINNPRRGSRNGFWRPTGIH